MKLLTLFALFAGIALAQQQGAPVTITNYPTDQPTLWFDYDGSNNPIYECLAKPKGPWSSSGSPTVPATFSWTRAASTLTSIVVSSNTGTATTSTAHGLQVGQAVTVSGATVDTDLNGVYVIQTVGSSTTFTITTVAVANATYNESTLVVTTSAPRLTAAIWSITRMQYSGSNLISKQWSNGLPATMNQICANRTTLTYY